MARHPVLRHSVFWPALAAGAAMLAGCSGPVADQSGYPDLNIVPPASKVKLLTPAEQAATATQLRARARAAQNEYPD